MIQILRQVLGQQRTPLFSAALTATVVVVVASCAKEEPPPPPPPPVEVAKVLVKTVPTFLESIGQTRGSKEVEIRARVEGVLESVDFQEGTFITQGQLLYTIDPRPFQATLAEAKGKMGEAQAQYLKARQDVVRFKPLVEQNAISRQEYDTAVAYEQAARATVDAARASVDAAAIDLGYTRIEAPIDGLVGKTEVQVGNLVSQKDNTLLTTISNVDPIRVRLNISEPDYLMLARAHGATPPPAAEPVEEKPSKKKKSAEAEEKPAEEGRLEMILADGSSHPFKGSVVFADRNIDPTTGTLLIEAEFPNPDKLVRSGQYARVRARTGIRENAVLVPQRAVQELQATFSVAVVGKDNVVAMRKVKPGPRVDSLWIIDEGLSPGDQVVVEGTQKVREGLTVSPKVVAIHADVPAPSPAANP